MNKKKIPDRRAMEKMTSDLSRLLQNKEFKSEKEVKEYLDSIMKGGGTIPEAPPKTGLEYAQDIMYEAWESDSPKERVKLAKEALDVCADCADAYNLLAEEEAETLQEASEYYRKGMEAGMRALGEEIFEENDGHFWGYMPSRPYMRSRLGYVECLWESGEHDEAIRHAKEMLKLNSSDNQGIRYILAAYLADLGSYDELDKFLNQGEHKDDCTAEWLYTRALVSFVKNGDSNKATVDLREALKSNQYVPEYLTGKKPIPRSLPDRITMGGEDEGFCYASRYIEAWKKVSGAIDWLKEKAGVKIVPKAGRDEPCPCGSGKKYKKCCGA